MISESQSIQTEHTMRRHYYLMLKIKSLERRLREMMKAGGFQKGYETTVLL